MAAAVAEATPRAPAEMVALEPHLEVVVAAAVEGPLPEELGLLAARENVGCGRYEIRSPK